MIVSCCKGTHVFPIVQIFFSLVLQSGKTNCRRNVEVPEAVVRYAEMCIQQPGNQTMTSKIACISLKTMLIPYQVRTRSGRSTVFLRYIYGRFTVYDRRSTAERPWNDRRTAGPGAESVQGGVCVDGILPKGNEPETFRRELRHYNKHLYFF